MFPISDLSALRANGPIARMSMEEFLRRGEQLRSSPLPLPPGSSAEAEEGRGHEKTASAGTPSPSPLPIGEAFDTAAAETPHCELPRKEFPHDDWKNEIPARAYDLLDWTSDAFADPAEEFPRAAFIAGAVRLTEVKPETIRWLWPGRIPLGRVTLLVSDPGIGKSLLTLDIAARVSTGAQWPDECSRHTPCAVTESGERQGDKETARQADTPANPSLTLSPCLPVSPSSVLPAPCSQLSAPGSVLLLTAEDNLADTIRPRLEALGADCSRIVAISTDHGEHAHTVPRAFALRRDLARLDNLLATMPDCRLVILDPVTAYLGESDEQSNADIRNLLASLAAMARDRGLAVLIVNHLRKTQGAAIYRTMGSLAFVACARAAWIIAKDPTDKNKRLFLPIKNNLAPEMTGLAYTIESSPAGTPVIRWAPEPVNITAETIVGAAKSSGRPDDERQYAITWLQNQLAEGSRLARELKHEADANGISYGTLRRAFRQLGGEAFRRGNFPSSPWHWQLPRTDAQNPQQRFMRTCQRGEPESLGKPAQPPPFTPNNPSLK
jgi:putative DNA primase/helicase